MFGLTLPVPTKLKLLSGAIVGTLTRVTMLILYLVKNSSCSVVIACGNATIFWICPNHVDPPCELCPRCKTPFAVAIPLDLGAGVEAEPFNAQLKVKFETFAVMASLNLLLVLKYGLAIQVNVEDEPPKVVIGKAPS
jgi:hypothetical protein